MQQFENILVGADPEVFITKGSTLVSGHTFPCGTKERPRLLASGGVQIDGMALEFNVKPSRTRVEFVSNVVRVFNDLNKIVKKQDKDATILVVPTANFGKEYIDSMPEKVKELGCNPDYNAYTGQPNPTPNADRPFRTGAGHVHVGFTEDMDTNDAEHFARCCALSRQLDYYLGLPSLAWDSDNQRRELYGKAGAFRSKSYGMEYRTLSNAWVADKNLMAFVYDRTLEAIRALNEGVDLDSMYPGLAREIIDLNVLDWADRFPQISHLQFGK
jgi:hypothetical protein